MWLVSFSARFPQIRIWLFFYLSTAVLTLVAMTASSPHADNTVHMISLPSAIALVISSPISPSGTLRSSRVFPPSSIKEKTIVDIQKLKILALNVRHIHVVSGRTDIFVFLLCEDIQRNQVNLSMAVLASL